MEKDGPYIRNPPIPQSNSSKMTSLIRLPPRARLAKAPFPIWRLHTSDKWAATARRPQDVKPFPGTNMVSADPDAIWGKAPNSSNGLSFLPPERAKFMIKSRKVDMKGYYIFDRGFEFPENLALYRDNNQHYSLEPASIMSMDGMYTYYEAMSLRALISEQSSMPRTRHWSPEAPSSPAPSKGRNRSPTVWVGGVGCSTRLCLCSA